LYWRLGLWQKAQQTLTEIEHLRQKNENPLNLSLLRLRQAEMAYAEGRFETAITNARKAIAAMPASGDQAEIDARLIEALTSIRTGRRNEGIQSALQLAREFEESKLAGIAASARLAIAEALAGIGENRRARDLALDALKFFEPRNVWESVWRAHLMAARASEESADISVHRGSARSALAQMRNLWPSSDVSRYLQRPDIKLLYGDVPF
jgi:tetratricopeptide (TPR) repeat protein